MTGRECAASTARLRDLVGVLGAFPGESTDAARVDRIRALEELKNAVAAAQAAETSAFVASQRAAQQAAGVRPDRIGRGIAAQVAQAKRMSPFQAQRYVGWAMVLTSELPATFAVLRAGRTSEWRAMLLARETGWLSREHRERVDRELAPRLAELGDRQVENEAKRLAYRLDPHGYVRRIAAARADRRVTLRPAPDLMCRLDGLLPVEQGIAAHTALTRAADALRAAGDARGRGQLMADLVVERLTGQARAAAVPVEVNVVISDETLLGRGTEPGLVPGYGPIPAPVARELALGADSDTPRWLRRLYAQPDAGRLVAMESNRRCFTPAQRQFVRVRDHGLCRTPYCDAPIRHVDHVVPAEAGGPTEIGNGQGLCEACNYARQAAGWLATATNNNVVTTTPTGHRYRSRAPDSPGKRVA